MSPHEVLPVPKFRSLRYSFKKSQLIRTLTNMIYIGLFSPLLVIVYSAHSTDLVKGICTTQNSDTTTRKHKEIAHFLFVCVFVLFQYFYYFIFLSSYFCNVFGHFCVMFGISHVSWPYYEKAKYFGPLWRGQGGI